MVDVMGVDIERIASCETTVEVGVRTTSANASTGAMTRRSQVGGEVGQCEISAASMMLADGVGRVSMEPKIRYARSPDGTNIAHWAIGSGRTLVYMPPMPWCHLEREWSIPQWRQRYERLASDRQVVPSALLMAIRSRLLHQLPEPKLAVIAAGGWDEVRFHEPVRSGDTLRLQQEFLAHRESASKPDRDVLTSRMSLINQYDVTVLSHIDKTLVNRRQQRTDIG